MGLITRASAASLPSLMPADRIETVDLLARAADTADGSAYADPVPWTARRKPTSLQTIAMLGGSAEQQWADFQLYKNGGQTTDPAIGFRIVGAPGDGWDVKWVRDVHFGVAWTCHCVKMLGGRPSTPSLSVVAAGPLAVDLLVGPPGSLPESLAYYELWATSESGGTEYLGQVAADASWVRVLGLADNTEYTLSLRAVAADGQKSAESASVEVSTEYGTVEV